MAGILEVVISADSHRMVVWNKAKEMITTIPIKGKYTENPFVFPNHEGYPDAMLLAAGPAGEVIFGSITMRTIFYGTAARGVTTQVSFRRTLDGISAAGCTYWRGMLHISAAGFIYSVPLDAQLFATAGSREALPYEGLCTLVTMHKGETVVVGSNKGILALAGVRDKIYTTGNKSPAWRSFVVCPKRPRSFCDLEYRTMRETQDGHYAASRNILFACNEDYVLWQTPDGRMFITLVPLLSAHGDPQEQPMTVHVCTTSSVLHAVINGTTLLVSTVGGIWGIPLGLILTEDAGKVGLGQFWREMDPAGASVWIGLVCYRDGQFFTQEGERVEHGYPAF